MNVTTAANPAVNYFLNALPHFCMYFLAAAALGVLFLAAYVMLTPQKEFKLIAEGNTAASLSLTGTFLGFAIPMAVVIGHSVSLLDMFLWGIVVLMVQSIIFTVVSHFLFKSISQQIVDNKVASGVFLGGMGLGFGVLTAACMVP